MHYYRGNTALQHRVLSGRIDPTKSEYQVLNYCLLITFLIIIDALYTEKIKCVNWNLLYYT